MSQPTDPGPATALAQEAAETLMPANLAVTRVEAVAGGPSPVQRALPVFAWIGVGWMVIVILLALLAPVLPIPDPQKPIVGLARQPPQAGHWFGGDAIGRDVFSRIIWGSRASLMIGFGSILIGMLIGVPVGVLAGYMRGWVDGVATFVLDVLLAIPAIIFAAAITAFYGHETKDVILALGIVAIPLLARIVRANTIVYARREFVTAARALGATHVRTMTREVFPNVVPATYTIAALGVGVAIVAEGALAFLGLGLGPDAVSWGYSLAQNMNVFSECPWVWIFPCLFIVLTVIALNLIGDAIRQKFDVREGAL